MPITGYSSALLSLLEVATRAANEAVEVPAACRAVLVAAAQTDPWSVGHLWVPDATGALVSSGVWTGDVRGFPSLRAGLARARPQPGVGVVGRAVAAGALQWTTELDTDPTLVTGGVMLEVGATCAVPVTTGRGVAAVLQLFSREPRPAEPDALLVLASVAAHLGRVADRTFAATRQAAYDDERTNDDHLTERNRIRDEVIATMSHELRTPLTSISGYVEMLREGDAGPLAGQQGAILDTILRNVARLRTLADDLLVVSAMDAGPLTLACVPTSLPDLIARVVESATPLAARRNQRIEALIAPEVGYVAADGAQLARAITALLSNAVKFSPAGAPVSVHASSTGLEVDIRVTDHGSGIPAADLERIFERYYRTELADRQAVQGVGLGLTIARDIVEAHRGRLSAASVLGEGSTFTIHLPAGEAGHR